MIEEMASVQSVEDSLVRVVTTQSSACQQCNESASCSTSVLSKFFGNRQIELQLRSDIALTVGDQVLLGIEEKMLVKLTLLIYLMPLLFMFLFALLGGVLEAYFNLDTELLSIILAVTGLVAGYFAISVFIEKKYKPQNIKPVILKKL